jgi:hypothetical protein
MCLRFKIVYNLYFCAMFIYFYSLSFWVMLWSRVFIPETLIVHVFDLVTAALILLIIVLLVPAFTTYCLSSLLHYDGSRNIKFRFPSLAACFTFNEFYCNLRFTMLPYWLIDIFQCRVQILQRRLLCRDIIDSGGSWRRFRRTYFVHFRAEEQIKRSTRSKQASKIIACSLFGLLYMLKMGHYVPPKRQLTLIVDLFKIHFKIWWIPFSYIFYLTCTEISKTVRKKSHVRSNHRWEYNIKKYLQEMGVGTLSGFIWLRIGSSGGMLWTV